MDPKAHPSCGTDASGDLHKRQRRGSGLRSQRYRSPLPGPSCCCVSCASAACAASCAFCSSNCLAAVASCSCKPSASFTLAASCSRSPQQGAGASACPRRKHGGCDTNTRDIARQEEDLHPTPNRPTHGLPDTHTTQAVQTGGARNTTEEGNETDPHTG